MRNEQTGGQTLVDEHRVLWHEIEVRRGEVLQALGDGDWPAAQLVRGWSTTSASSCWTRR